MEKSLSDQDFEPDNFATHEDDKKGPTQRLSFSLQEDVDSLPVLRNDTAWDFVDLDRGRSWPPVYMVDVNPDNFRSDIATARV